MGLRLGVGFVVHLSVREFGGKVCGLVGGALMALVLPAGSGARSRPLSSVVVC